MSSVNLTVQPLSLVGSKRSNLVTSVTGSPTPTSASVTVAGGLVLYAPALRASQPFYVTVSPTSVIVNVADSKLSIQEALNAIEVAVDKTADAASPAASPAAAAVAKTITVTLNDDDVGHSIEMYPQGLTLTYSAIIGHEDAMYGATTSSTDNQMLVMCDLTKSEGLETVALNPTLYDSMNVAALNALAGNVSACAQDVEYDGDRVAVFIAKNSTASGGAVVLNADNEFEAVTIAPLAVATGSLAVTQAWSMDGNLYLKGTTLVSSTTTNLIRVIRDLKDADEVSTVVSLASVEPTYFSVTPGQERVYWVEVDGDDDLIKYKETDDQTTYGDTTLYATRSNVTYGSVTHLCAIGELDVAWISSVDDKYTLWRALDGTVKSIDFDEVVPDDKFDAGRLYDLENLEFQATGWMKYWHDESMPLLACAGYVEFTRNQDVENDVEVPTKKMIPCVCVISDIAEKSPVFHYYFAQDAFRADGKSGAFVRLAVFPNKGRMVATGASNDEPAMIINHSAIAQKSATGTVTMATDPSAPPAGMDMNTIWIIVGSVVGGIAFLVACYFLYRYYMSRRGA